ncbi:unnamed protein product [Porites evermanni]|uniref:Uncharacterized protein n=1 Tax=Porites evermanni TaxID=104178 RepID=A0ABN8PTA6_9CNID|nr:unnamed protein product [Porites evermanni]
MGFLSGIITWGLVDLQRVKLKLRENGQQKTSNLSCNNAANELNNDVALFTTHNKPVLQQIRLLTGLNWVIKRTTSLFNLFCSNVAKQVTRFCCPFYRSLSTRCSYYLATIYSFKLDTQFTSGTDKFSLQNPFNPFKHCLRIADLVKTPESRPRAREAVANSSEYRLGLNKNAKMQGNIDLVSTAGLLTQRQFKGVLMETYVTGEMKEFSSEELRVNKTIDQNSYYGVVLGDGRLSEKTFQNCFEDYFLSNQAEIFEIVKANAKPIESWNMCGSHSEGRNTSWPWLICFFPL